MNGARCAAWMGTLGLISAMALAGDLTPPAGPVAPTPGPEPRTPIDATHTPGDADSIYKITAPGSYYLTGNLTGAAGKHGIEITSSNVTVDLMGFDVAGVPNSLDGIVTSLADLRNIEIRNGTVRAWGFKGIDMGYGQWYTYNVLIEHVRVTETAYIGIFAGINGDVTDCTVGYTGTVGIYAPGGCTITNCSVYGAGTTGISAGACTLTNCVVSQCSGDGIGASNCSVSNCIARGCTGDGIDAQGACIIQNNVCTYNGQGAAEGSGIIVTGDRNRIIGNNCSSNDRGVNVDGDANLIDSNSADSNAAGFDIDGADNLVIRNTAFGNVSNYSILAGNSAAPLVSVVDSNGWAGITNANHPWANLTH